MPVEPGEASINYRRALDTGPRLWFGRRIDFGGGHMSFALFARQGARTPRAQGRNFGAGLAAVGIAIASLIVPVGPAQAVACSTTSGSNWHTGFDGGSGYVGASAVIATRPVQLCTGGSAGHFGTGYVMVNDGNCGWAQSGFADQGVGTQHYIQATADACLFPGNTYTQFSSVFSPNVGYTYKVQLDSGYPTCWNATCFHFYWGSKRVAYETSWSPATAWGGYSQVEYSGETYYAETKMPGTNTSRMNFSSMKGQYTGWSVVPCAQLGPTNYQVYGLSHLTSLYNSCQNFDVWSN